MDIFRRHLLEISDSEHVKDHGLTTVTINNGNFNNSKGLALFRLEGLITFNNCSFSSQIMWFKIYRSQYEQALNVDTLQSFQSYMSNGSIKIYQSQIWLDWFFRTWVHKTGRLLQLIDCDLKCDFNIKSHFVSNKTT